MDNSVQPVCGHARGTHSKIAEPRSVKKQIGMTLNCENRLTACYSFLRKRTHTHTPYDHINYITNRALQLES